MSSFYVIWILLAKVLHWCAAQHLTLMPRLAPVKSPLAPWAVDGVSPGPSTCLPLSWRDLVSGSALNYFRQIITAVL